VNPAGPEATMVQRILSRFHLSMPGYFFCASMLSAITLSTLALVADPAAACGHAAGVGGEPIAAVSRG
jgi:hypothetical protein